MRSLFRSSEAVPKPVTKRTADIVAGPQSRVGTDPRPVTILKNPLRFIDNATGKQISKADAITLMRAYKQAQGSPRRKATPIPSPSPRQTKRSASFLLEAWLTDLKGTKRAECIFAQTFPNQIAAAWKLSALCMEASLRPAAEQDAYAVEFFLKEAK